jgi:hypothetical protein
LAVCYGQAVTRQAACQCHPPLHRRLWIQTILNMSVSLWPRVRARTALSSVTVMSAAVTRAPLFQPDSHHEADGAAAQVLIAPGLIAEDAQRPPDRFIQTRCADRNHVHDAAMGTEASELAGVRRYQKDRLAFSPFIRHQQIRLTTTLLRYITSFMILDRGGPNAQNSRPSRRSRRP